MDANYNLAGLVDRIKAKLKDAEFSDEDIKQFINDAYFETLGETRYQFLEKYYQQQVQESGAVLLPRDFQSAIILTANDGKSTTTLKYKPSQDFMANIGEPTNHYCYSVYGNKLFYGLPNISNDLDEDGDERFYTLNVYYQGKPAELINDTDKPVIPAEYGELLVLRALARCEQSRDNFDYAAIYENKADELLINMNERYCPRQQEDANRARLPITLRARY